MARRVLLVVEGEKQERRLFKQIFKTFDFGCDYEICLLRDEWRIQTLAQRMARCAWPGATVLRY